MVGLREKGRARAGAGAILAAALGLVLGAGGCSLGRLDPDYLIASNRLAVVKENAESYAQDLRWGRLKEAVAQVAPEQRVAFLELFEAAGQPIHFTSFEIVSVDLGQVRSRAEVLVTYELYRPPSINETTIRERQSWLYDVPAGRWFIEPDLSVFAKPSPSSKAAPGVSSGGR